MYVLVSHRSPILRSLNIERGVEILTIDKRIATVLLTSKITYQGERIVRLILVGRRLCA